MKTRALEGIGLTRNESLVYLTLLEIGRSSLGKIVDSTRMHRRTIYDCLDRLQDRGLVSMFREGKTRYFSPAPPKRLKDLLKEKEADINAIFSHLETLASGSKVQTEVTVHKGREGLRSIMEDLINARPKLWLSLTSSGLGSAYFPYDIAQFHQRRIRHQIRLRILFAKNPDAILRSKELSRLLLTTVKFMGTRESIPLSFWIYKDKVAFLLWESTTGILIENKETAETFTRYFSMLWKTASS